MVNNEGDQENFLDYVDKYKEVDDKTEGLSRHLKGNIAQRMVGTNKTPAEARNEAADEEKSNDHTV